MIESYILLGTLGIHSVEDLRDQKITIKITLLSGIIALILHLCFPNQTVYEMLAGTLPGVAVLALSRLTRGKIGIGDGLVFMLTGLYLGLPLNLTLLFVSFSLAAIWGLFLLAVKPEKGRGQIPFIPFLFLGYFGMILWSAL